MLDIAADHPAKWTLRIRKPAWALETGTVIVDGAAVAAQPAASGFIEIEREWKDSTVTVTFAKRLTREPLPGDPTRFALLDGPVVLAAITASGIAVVRD